MVLGATPQASPTAAPLPPSSDRGVGGWYGLGVLILASMAGNAIPQVMLLVAEAMKQELALSDTQVGALRGIAVTLVVALASYPISWLADRTDRRFIFAVCVSIWSLGAVGSGLAGSYGVLFACGMAIAAGEAVLGPVTFSLIPDLFPERRRVLANSIFFVSQLLGYSIGLALGGALVGLIDQHRASLPAGLASLATWRVAMVATAVPAVALIPLLLLMPLRRVQRGASAVASGQGVFPYLRRHARALFPVFIGFGSIGTANFTVFGWIAILVVRQFKEDPARVGVALSQVFAAGSIGGLLAANLLARLFNRYDRSRTPGRVAQVGALVALVLSCLYLFARSPTEFYVIGVFQIAASFGGLALSPTLTQALAPNLIRARLLAVGGLFYTGFGAMSPLLVGALSDALGSEHLLHAMLLVAVPAFAAGALLLRLSERHLDAALAEARESGA